MGWLKLSSKTKANTLTRIPAGCLTVDVTGRILSSTLPQSFSFAETRKIARVVLTAFHTAPKAQLMLNELHIHYPALKILARELKGGAIIFLTPLFPAQSSA